MDLAGWQIQPPVAYVAVAALLYWLGGRRRRTRTEPLRVLSFGAGLVTIVLALDSPLDDAADKLFWAHMTQHVLLLTLAPPLILLGRPWPRMWRALPLRLRTKVGRGIAQSGVAAPLRMLARPLPAFVLFNATIIAWHIPSMYNATLTSNAVHQTEHAMFFFTGLVFWARVIDPGPLRPRLEWPWRIAYVTGAMVVGLFISLVLVMYPHALVSHYANIHPRPMGLSALDDQQIAGGVMWVPGSISYSIAAIYGFWRWLEPERRRPPKEPVPAAQPDTPTPPHETPTPPQPALTV